MSLIFQSKDNNKITAGAISRIWKGSELWYQKLV